MPKVLLITTLEAGTTFQSRAILNALGIESDVMYAVSSTSYRLLQPVSDITSALDPATTTMRNLLRRYQAVLINVAHDANANFTVYDPVLNVWMQSWNAPEDPPVIHFGQNLNTARTGLNLPADFPIVRANTADVPEHNVAVALQLGNARATGHHGHAEPIRHRGRPHPREPHRLHPQRTPLVGHGSGGLSGRPCPIRRAARTACRTRFP
jgi:hypothetical protein